MNLRSKLINLIDSPYLKGILITIPVFILLTLAIGIFLDQIYVYRDVKPSVLASIMIAASNLVFVFLVWKQIRDSVESLEAQRKSLDTQREILETRKATFQPLMKKDFNIGEDEIVFNIANEGKGPAKNVEILLRILYANKEYCKVYKLDNLAPKETFVPRASSKPANKISSHLDDFYKKTNPDEGMVRTSEGNRDLKNIIEQEGNARMELILGFENLLDEKQTELVIDKKVSLSESGDRVVFEDPIGKMFFRELRDIPETFDEYTHVKRNLDVFRKSYQDDQDLNSNESWVM